MPPLAETPQETDARRRYAVVGTGHRAQMYVDAVLGPHRDAARVVAWCEPNPVRAAYYDDLVRAAGEAPVPTYAPDDLEAMIARERVDAVVVTTPDHTHADVVARVLAAGADVVLEKPMTTTGRGCRTIADAVAAHGRDVVVTFNYRYSPRNTALKRLIADGEIGEVTAVHFEWVLDTVHGADYFRRWHRDKESSGGLLVHKSSHHVDLVNWWVGDVPDLVFARGGLRFYGPDGARPAGERPARGTRGAPDGPTADAPRDRFLLDLADDPRLADLYLGAEAHDGYRRDQDPFAAGVTIEDTAAVLVQYARGALLTYSLTAYGPWEGYRVSVTGTRGRAELEVVERGAVVVGPDGRPVLDPSAQEAAASGPVRPRGERLVVQRHWEEAREVPIPVGQGAHGGGDAMLLRDVFRGAGDDPLGRPAGWRDGLLAAGVGIAANRSLETGQPVRVKDAVGGAA
ncbi:Gfo/Idh/MocA family protein [Cellulosimicrobium sp. CUA-896]|uniref:Gfo/Idh/MocA family protein n=1 Tax=Cellulosimicrobium sp. CUA-896 TaxID=1517881 RepID=UPI00096A4CD3|nr:Gfo/Idh/MocA family oxidoreductase [Cellulosimicrobium sp. CUA-896]